ncbi:MULTISPECIES: glycosyltransferase [Rheinheimera]|uniref:Glycosyltransferase n=1 Tax=Rheinheimera aquimaris TaxID=412437 RepID=A0ABN1D9D0_9GAMM|nr:MULTISPECIES: glycosyltransferase [Rheinheimera]MCB5212655.1 glycosyltransferase [Rheinheimera aquimaris]
MPCLNNSYAPVVVFAFNRPDHLAQTLDALVKCELAAQSNVIIIIDGPRNEDDRFKQEIMIRDLHEVSGFLNVEVRAHESNVGLAQNISTGITAVMAEYGQAIVLEDDILVSPHFLRFMNDALNLYQNKKEVWHISGWNFPIPDANLPSCFLWRTALGWGWATWADRWQHYKREPQALIQRWDQIDIEEFNLYGAYDFWDQVIKNASGQLHTWAVFWYSTIFEHGGLCLNPTKAMTTNIGFDGSGTHNAGAEFTLAYDPHFDYAKDSLPAVLSENREVVSAIIRYNKQVLLDKQTAQNQTNKNLKNLVNIALSEHYDFSYLTGKSVAVFGSASLSVIVSQLLKEHGIAVCAFLVSKSSQLADIDGVPVISPTQWPHYNPQIVINCIEGPHEVSVANSLTAALPGCRVISWRSL